MMLTLEDLIVSRLSPIPRSDVWLVQYVYLPTGEEMQAKLIGDDMGATIKWIHESCGEGAKILRVYHLVPRNHELIVERVIYDWRDRLDLKGTVFIDREELPS